MSESKEKANAKVTTDKGTKNIQCASCGSTDVDIVFDDLAKCNRCGAKIKIPKNITNNFVVNKTVKNVESNEEIKFVDKIISEKECLKGFYRTLIFNRDTPLDILDCTVSDLHIDYVQFLAIEANYKGSYTASVGHDREEQYIDEYTVYDSNLKRNVTKQTVKSRTVTDWTPVSGNVDQDIVTCVSLGKNVETDWSDCFADDLPLLASSGSISNYSEKNQKDIEIEIPTKDNVSHALEKGQLFAEASVGFGSQKVQNLDVRVTGAIKTSNQYIVPRYNFSYTYDNKEYKVNSPAYSDERYSANAPMDEDYYTSIKNRKLKPMTITCGILLGIFTILAIVLPFVLRSYWSFALEIVFLISAIIIYNVYQKKALKAHDSAKNDLFDTKKELYINKMKEKGYVLTEDEIHGLDKIVSRW